MAGVSFHDFSAGGETGRLIRDKAWDATSLGPRAAWPPSLLNYLSMIGELPTAAIIFWGPDHVQLYNDGYAVIMGPRHPQHLGSTFRECWPEAYEAIEPWMQRVLQQGETVEVTRTLVPLTRYGFTEEAYFTFSFSPLRDDHGAIAGVLQLVTEVTEVVLGERRAALLHALSNQTPHARTVEDATRLAIDALGAAAADFPYCLVYSVDREQLTLAGSTGTSAAFPDTIDLQRTETALIAELRRAVRDRELAMIESDTPGFVAPILSADRETVLAVLVAGVSQQLRFDEPYRKHVQLACAQIGTLVAAASAYDGERKRAEALAEIDRAKTEFFSNVSHEFRTPLTLILGPLEDALGQSSKTLHGDAFDAVYRNALRLLRLVNTLLDFARLEANRLTSSFEPTDLSVLTAGLAGSFQSLFDSAGLRLRVECPPITEPVYVDREQWEKIVLNLMSNAYKFTFDGEIAVRLREHGEHVQLSVSDTGTGIPAEELPRLFERFHRVKGARGRSFEGTGIGLALVRELAKQHGGTIEVDSAVGKGTTFTVSIPKRNERVTAPARDGSATTEAKVAPYLLEASHWIARTHAAPLVAAGPRADRARVLVVDDNADMREHLVRLLSPSWTVETAEDGEVALAAAHQHPPDLILSDVMMPRMDGVALVSALRANPATSTIPIVLLSARAGEEAVVGGFETGADDYLVKPFAARELLARVHTHLHMAQLRRKWQKELERANKELEAFSSAVSHDLRAPLRAIDGFGAVLLEDYASKLDDEGRDCIARIRSSAKRMAQLIDDLLSLSRITRAPLVRERVDVSAAARRIIAELRERDPKRSVEVTVADEVVVNADPRLVAVALENLVGNAWKYTSRQPHAHLEIGREDRDGETIYFVRDNGAGFDMNHAVKLFTPFYRLHSDAEFEGTGIGLSTVQRIIARHGGRIWAEAAPGRGATFFFTLADRAA